VHDQSYPPQMIECEPRVRKVAATCLLVLAAGCARSTPSGSTRSDPQARSDASANAQIASNKATAGWKLGERYSYRLALTTNLALSEATAFDFDVSADLVVIPTPATTTDTTLLLALRNWKFVSRVPETQADFDKLVPAGEKSGCLLVLSSGHLTEMQFASGLSALIANIYREIGSYLQFAKGADGESRYQDEEYDTSGKYLAEYLREGASDGWRRHKLRYLSILGATSNVMLPAKIVPTVLASESEIQLLPGGRPGKIHAQDEIAVNGAQAPLRSKTTLTLEAGSSGAVNEPPDFSAASSHMVKVAADQPYGDPGALDALDSARIRGLTFAKVSQQLRTLADAERAHGAPSSQPSGEQKSFADKQRLYVALAAIFRRDPETVGLAVAQVRAKSPISATLVDALGSSGSATAHEALGRLTSDEALDPKLRARAVTALARTPVPSDAAIAALKARLDKDPFASDALFGLGTYTRRLRDAGDREKMTSLGDYLVSRLHDAGSIVPHLLAALGAITNSGYDNALPSVTPFLSDPRDTVRAAAVRALQSMQSERIDPLIAARLRSDGSSEVRISAIDAARVREPDESLTQAVAAAAVGAEDARVRYRAVDLIVHWLPNRPELHSTLATVATNDKEPRVRERARASL